MKLSRFWVFLLLFAIAIPMFVFSQSNSGWNTQTTTATFGFGSQKFNSQLASVFKVQIPFPVYVSGKITMVVAPWWLLALVFMIFYPIIDIITGFVPPFSKAAEMGSKGVERSKTVFTIGFSLLAMFVTPLVPYVVQLVTVGTTFGVWWFWMLLFMMFIWGVNWLFGESPFGDPFRKGAVGLGHIGSAGMTKFKKHFKEEMNDTTNEAKYLADLDALMNQNIQKNQKERDLIENLRQLLNLLVQARNVNSSAARPILDKMRTRLLELKSFIESEDMIMKTVEVIAKNLKTINVKGDNITSRLSAVKKGLSNLIKDIAALSSKPHTIVASEFANYTPTLLGGKTFPEYINSLTQELKKDYLLDLNQAGIADKLNRLNSFAKNPVRQELGIINSMVSDIDEILLGRVSQSKANKFIQLAGSFIWNLQQIEKNNAVLVNECTKVCAMYKSFLQKEKDKTMSLSIKIENLEKEFKSVKSKGSFT